MKTRHLERLVYADEAPFGDPRCFNGTPPTEVVLAYNGAGWHSARIDVEWDAAGAAADADAGLLRSAQDLGARENPDRWSHLLFAPSPKVFVVAAGNRLIAYAPSPAAAEEHLTAFARRYARPTAARHTTFQLMTWTYGSFDREEVALPPSETPKGNELEWHYGDGFTTWHEEFTETVRKPRAGLSLMEGPCGTGKTTYIRFLMGELAATHCFYYFQSNAQTQFDQPEFVSFWKDELRGPRGSKRFVLVLEDCEEALMVRGQDNRSRVGAILNLTDGLLGDFLRAHVICTVNCPVGHLDPAIMRPGRLVAHRHFGRLPRPAAIRLASKLGRELEPGDDHSLAEIFAGPSVRSVQPRPVGFAR